MLDPVAAFRLAGHHLDRRLPNAEFASVVGAIGIRDVQGSGLLTLHARLENVRADSIDRALNEQRVVRVASARGAETLVPVDDVPMFTVGTLPADEESLRVRLKPFLPVLDASGHSATEALGIAQSVARKVLADGPVDIGGLSGSLTRSLPELSPMCRGRCGVEHIDQGLFDLVGESGIWRVDRAEGKRQFVRMDKPTASREECRAKLVVRYLRCYGPSTVPHFAEWCGIGINDAARSLAGGPTTEISRRTYVLTKDLARLEAPPSAEGVRILPPRDPYLLGRDRAAVVTEPDVRRRIWRSTPTDGVVLSSGSLIATWRMKKRSGHLKLVLDPVTPLNRRLLQMIEAEFANVAALRGATSSEVVTT